MPAKKKVVKKEPEVKMTHIDEIWDVMQELQENLDFINDKLSRIMSRLGI